MALVPVNLPCKCIIQLIYSSISITHFCIKASLFFILLSNSRFSVIDRHCSHSRSSFSCSFLKLILNIWRLYMLICPSNVSYNSSTVPLITYFCTKDTLFFILLSNFPFSIINRHCSHYSMSSVPCLILKLILHSKQ